MPIYDNLLDQYFEHPCGCKRCGDVLPFIHSLDHLCDSCFDRDLERLVKELTQSLKEVHDASKEALKKAAKRQP